eukprot:TRINITY_DN85180_c0_g1_i1.p1 TRINITY_DN85180_c0_g1~~TRINITY_DN85180_c0_g1_i1.p1  ORF type:complete len:411 (+),score=103.75 TRINITY_DN85180_c0_g1_i1:388-1620(+)
MSASLPEAAVTFSDVEDVVREMMGANAEKRWKDEQAVLEKLEARDKANEGVRAAVNKAYVLLQSVYPDQDKMSQVMVEHMIPLVAKFPVLASSRSEGDAETAADADDDETKTDDKAVNKKVWHLVTSSTDGKMGVSTLLQASGITVHPFPFLTAKFALPTMQHLVLGFPSALSGDFPEAVDRALTGDSFRVVAQFKDDQRCGYYLLLEPGALSAFLVSFSNKHRHSSVLGFQVVHVGPSGTVVVAVHLRKRSGLPPIDQFALRGLRSMQAKCGRDDGKQHPFGSDGVVGVVLAARTLSRVGEIYSAALKTHGMEWRPADWLSLHEQGPEHAVVERVAKDAVDVLSFDRSSLQDHKTWMSGLNDVLSVRIESVSEPIARKKVSCAHTRVKYASRGRGSSWRCAQCGRFVKV